jgi:hypothetical protein
MKSAMADSRKKVRTAKGKMQLEQGSKSAPRIVENMTNAVDDVVSQQDEQKDREVDEQEDALSTTDELIIDD